MAVTFPYSLDQFADLLKIESVKWSIQRNDETSIVGSGGVIAVELAPPLWLGDVTLRNASHSEAKQAAARIRALRGPINSFMMYDPISMYPQADPDGTILGSAVVMVSGVGANYDAISLSGLPAGYIITVGDKVQITYTQGVTRHAFLEFSETKQATSGGAIVGISVFPHVPPAIAAGNAAQLRKPACKCIMVPKSHDPGTANAQGYTSGQSFQVIQRR